MEPRGGRELPRVAGAATCTTRINVNRFVGDMLDGRFNGFNPSFATINHVMSTSSSDYNGLSLSIRRPFRNSYMFQAAYTFGKAMDDTDQAVGATNIQDAADLGAEWAVAGYDVRHKLSFVAMWEAALLQEQRGPHEGAARRLADPGLRRLSDRQPNQRHQQRRVPGGRLQRGQQRW